MDASQELLHTGSMLTGATPQTHVLGGIRGLAVMFGGIELEGDAESDRRVGVEREFAIKVT
jgi:hypothetical protein